MDKVLTLLFVIKERPIPLLGKKSLERLVSFITGYTYCVYETTGVFINFLPGFQEYVQKLYSVVEAYHWSEIIVANSKTDEEAFESFYNILDDFCRENEMMNE